MRINRLHKHALPRGVIIYGSLVTPKVWASGGSTFEFSLYMFIFFGIAAFILTKVAKYYSKNVENKILMKIIEILPICLLVSPTFFIDDGNSLLLPSAVVIGITIASSNMASFYSLIVSVGITFLFMYFLKVSNLKNLQDVSKDKKDE